MVTILFRKRISEKKLWMHVPANFVLKEFEKLDLVRWGTFVSEMQQAANQSLNDSRATSRKDMMYEVASKMSAKYILFPIPQSELKLNNKMTQNPMW
jgi:hypothetical protein